jgi:hypothetical protein
MAQQTHRRKRWPKGTWMKLRSKEILIAFMEDKGFSNGRLAQYAKCSRAFIGYLRVGTKTSCTPALAERIAEALDVPLVALFEARTSAPSVNISNRRVKVPA